MKRSFLSYIKTPFFRVTSFLTGCVFAASLLTTVAVRAADGQPFFEIGVNEPTPPAANIIEDVAGEPVDWISIFDANGDPLDVVDEFLAPGSNGVPDYIDYGFEAATFIGDDISIGNLTDDTVFAQSNKNNDLPETWNWDSGNVPPKTDLSNIYYLARLVPVPADTDNPMHLLIYIATERIKNDGVTHIDNEFNAVAHGLDKDPECGDDGVLPGQPGETDATADDAPCEFTGTRSVGDFHVTMDFVKGGGIGNVEIREWNGSDYVFVTNSATVGCNADASICAFNNTVPISSGPWVSYDDHGNVTNTIDTNLFTEMVVDATELLGRTPCVGSVISKTRSSPGSDDTFNAELKDFGLGAFPLCSIDVDKDGDNLSKVGDDADYTYTISNTGVAKVYLQSVTDVFDDNSDDGEVHDLTAIAAAAGCDVLQPEGADGDSCTFEFSRTVEADDPEPVMNVVTAVYNDVANGSGSSLTDFDDHSVPLFAPAIDVDKTGDELSKVGDMVTYTITLSNNTVNNTGVETPALTCTATDPMLGGEDDPVFGPAVLALGDTSFDIEYTIQEGDVVDGQVVNTVTMHCELPDGFTNEIADASDSHTIDIFEPDFDIDKSGPELSKVGDEVTYTITLSNNSSENTPDLTCTVTDELLGGVIWGPSILPTDGDEFTVDHTIAAEEIGEDGNVHNTAVMSCVLPDEYTNELEDASDDHMIDIFDPSFDIDKSGNTLSKVGEEVTYEFTLSNNSSENTPDLTCTVTDELLGGVIWGPSTLPTDGDEFTVDHTIAAGDVDENDQVVNTATLSCTLPEQYTNELEDASDDHTIDIFYPMVSIDKDADCPAEPLVRGPTITYTYTIMNNSTGSEAPDLLLQSVVDSDNQPEPDDPAYVDWAALGNLLDAANDAGCDRLASGQECEFTAEFETADQPAGIYANIVEVLYYPEGFTNNVTDESDHECRLALPAPANIVIEKVYQGKSGEAFNYADEGLTETGQFSLTPLFSGEVGYMGPLGTSPFGPEGDGNSFAGTPVIEISIENEGETEFVSVEELFPLPSFTTLEDLQCAPASGAGTGAITSVVIPLDGNDAAAGVTLGSGEFAHCRFVNKFTPPLEGCTPGYWRQDQHFDSWVGTGYSPGDYYDEVFGVGPHITLLEAVWLGGNTDGEALMRHSVAALLNAASEVDYEFTEQEVKDYVAAAFASGNFNFYKNILAAANERDCPLN